MSAGHDDMCRWNGITRAHDGQPLGCDCARVAQVRADERERMTLPEWTQVVADARAFLRTEIAADIEAARDHFAERTDTPREHPLCRAYEDAARIARGEAL